MRRAEGSLVVVWSLYHSIFLPGVCNSLGCGYSSARETLPMQLLRTWGLVLTLISIGALPAPGYAQNRCRVTDPSDTPLNVRTAPYGKILGTLQNGRRVSVIDRASDRRGQPWVYIADQNDGQPIGWVYREFISCY